MIVYQRFCDKCNKDITDNNLDAKLQDNSINESKEFCDMDCLVAWVSKHYGLVIADKAA